VRIRVWNAYASNNSGSYSILGSFGSPDVAEDVAAEVLRVITAHSRWRSDPDLRGGAEEDGPEAPLAVWGHAQGLGWLPSAFEEWPEYSGDNVPGVTTAGSVVLIHEPYTVSMPSAFGEYFYKRGGRVTTELDHTHHPLISTLVFWVPWNSPDKAAQEVKARALCASLRAGGTSLHQNLEPDVALAIHETTEGQYAFHVAAVFTDLVAGVTAARNLATAADTRIHLKLSEALSSSGDLLATIRSAWAEEDPGG
jgi:hypothetical protein